MAKLLALCCLVLFAGFAAHASAQEKQALRLVQTIPVPGVKGRLDHMGIDLDQKRLFVAATTNNTVEVVDLTAGKVINLSANSNYGHALKLFQQTWLGSITRRTTVIVIGDGRTNYNPPNAWALQEIKRRCRRLLWLCPEDKASWGFGDSEMPLYARYCHRVEAVRSVDDLARVAGEMLP